MYLVTYFVTNFVSFSVRKYSHFSSPYLSGDVLGDLFFDIFGEKPRIALLTQYHLSYQISHISLLLAYAILWRF